MEIDSVMPRINEAMDTDLKVIDAVRKFFSNGVERLTQHLGWKRGDTLPYQQAYVLIAEQQKIFEGQENEKIRGVK